MLKSSANDGRPRIAVAGATGRVGSSCRRRRRSHRKIVRDGFALSVASDGPAYANRGASRDSRHRLTAHRPHYM